MKTKKETAETQRQYNEKHKDKIRIHKQQYYLDNKDHIDERDHQYRIINQDKINKRNREAYHNNIEKERERSRAYYHNNKDKERIRKQKFYIDNKDDIDTRNKQYAKDNPEVSNMIGQRYRTKKKNLPSTLTLEEWQKILDDHFHRCHYCGKKADNLHQEHKIPVSKGGGWTKDNIVPACISCNSAKRTRNYKKFVKNTNNRIQLKLFED